MLLTSLSYFILIFELLPNIFKQLFNKTRHLVLCRFSTNDFKLTKISLKVWSCPYNKFKIFYIMIWYSSGLFSSIFCQWKEVTATAISWSIFYKFQYGQSHVFSEVLYPAASLSILLLFLVGTFLSNLTLNLLFLELEWSLRVLYISLTYLTSGIDSMINLLFTNWFQFIRE